jgi:hypothetical protein
MIIVRIYKGRFDLLTDIFISLSLYLDITMFYFIFAITIIHTHIFNKRIDVFQIAKSFITWGIIYAGLLFLSGDPIGDLRN